MNTNEKFILKTERLTKTFRSGEEPLTVLDDVSIGVEPGATCAVVGPSGSGKTTLLGLCAGLDRPSAGRVLFDGEDITALSEDARAAWRVKTVGFVFQTFRLISTLTALENVMVPAELNKDVRARALAQDLLNQVGLGDRAHHFPGQLSGGEQQRVALARAFINRPRILFADEPTGNLDAKNSDKVIRLLFDMNRLWHATLVLVTHNQDLAAHTRTVFHLEKGRLVP